MPVSTHDLIPVGTKIRDLEYGLWGLIWKATPNIKGHRYRIHWADGSVNLGFHDAVIADMESGVIVIE